MSGHHESSSPATALNSTWRRVSDVTLHVVEAGPESGPLVILLHGFPDFWWTWRKQIHALADAGYRVIAPDQRGYNLSDKPTGVAAYRLDAIVEDVVGLADTYGRKQFRLVGHDWGGIVAWGMALRHPERVARLAILDAPHPGVWQRQMLRHPTQALRSSYVAFFQLPWLPERALTAGNFAMARRSLRLAAPTVFTEDVLRRYVEAWSQPGAFTAMLNYYRALRRKPADLPRRVRAPTLVVWGANDAFLGQHLVQASLARCDRGESLVLSGVGHWPQLEASERVNEALLAFLGRP